MVGLSESILKLFPSLKNPHVNSYLQEQLIAGTHYIPHQYHTFVGVSKAFKNNLTAALEEQQELGWDKFIRGLSANHGVRHKNLGTSKRMIFPSSIPLTNGNYIYSKEYRPSGLHPGSSVTNTFMGVQLNKLQTKTTLSSSTSMSTISKVQTWPSPLGNFTFLSTTFHPIETRQ